MFVVCCLWLFVVFRVLVDCCFFVRGLLFVRWWLLFVDCIWVNECGRCVLLVGVCCLLSMCGARGCRSLFLFLFTLFVVGRMVFLVVVCWCFLVVCVCCVLCAVVCLFVVV